MRGAVLCVRLRAWRLLRRHDAAVGMNRCDAAEERREQVMEMRQQQQNKWMKMVKFIIRMKNKLKDRLMILVDFV